MTDIPVHSTPSGTRRPFWRRTVLAAALVALAGSAAAQPAAPTAEATLGADAVQGDLLGFAVALDGDRALVGAPSDDAAGSASGAARVYVRVDGQWVSEARLALDGAAAGDYFGISVALDGDRALVGAYGRDGGRGAAHVYSRVDGRWVWEASLVLPDAAAGDYFGISVALDGDRALVGAYGRDGGRGAAALFRRTQTGWIEEGQLDLEDGLAGDRFGWSVALDGDRALVGAYGRDGGRGAAALFAPAGREWTEEARFVGAAPGDNFGVAVALDGDRALVGAPFSDAHGTDSGTATALALTTTGWVEETVLTAADAEAQDRFGWSVALDGDRALVGIPLDDADAANSGTAASYVWAPSGWTEEDRFGGASISEAAGWSVALNAHHALVGAPYSSGAARVFGLAPLAATCTPGVPLSVGTFDVGAGAGGERVEIANGSASRTVDLGGCWIIALDPHTRAVTYAAAAAGAVRPGETFSFATTGGDQPLPPTSVPDGPGAVALVAGPVAVGDAVESVLPRLVAAVAYRGPDEVARLGGEQDVDAFATAFDRLLTTPTEPAAPSPFALAAAPNPTAGDATITFGLDAPATVSVDVYDAIGRKVAVLAEGPRGLGEHRVAFGGAALPAGPYAVRVIARGAAGASVQTVRLTVVR